MASSNQKLTDEDEYDRRKRRRLQREKREADRLRAGFRLMSESGDVDDQDDDVEDDDE